MAEYPFSGILDSVHIRVIEPSYVERWLGKSCSVLSCTEVVYTKLWGGYLQHIGEKLGILCMVSGIAL